MQAPRDVLIGLAYGLLTIALAGWTLAFAAKHFHGENEEQVFLRWHEAAKARHGGVISPSILRPATDPSRQDAGPGPGNPQP